jgi:hypothetical protein
MAISKTLRNSLSIFDVKGEVAGASGAFGQDRSLARIQLGLMG